jgi:hypothetical protein
MNTTNNSPKSSLGKTLAKYLGLFVVFIVLAVVAYTWLTLSFSYSTGERAGFLQKVSQKGWICKTWEGELSLVALPGAAPEKFEFSVRDDAIAARLNAAVGQRVALTYEQHRGIPSNCFGETEYFITDVKVISQPSTP